ncbi:hypothetical protein ACTXT7_014045 [Hymenolepis weldensis]
MILIGYRMIKFSSIPSSEHLELLGSDFAMFPSDLIRQMCIANPVPVVFIITLIDLRPPLMRFRKPLLSHHYLIFLCGFMNSDTFFRLRFVKI